MNIFAIETSCDETACAVVKDGREVLANVVASQIKTHEQYGGVIPEIAAREHLEAINAAIEETFRQAGTTQIDAFAATVGPGLVGCLLVGLNAAKALALVHGKPFIGVNHLNAHLCANYLDTDLKPPYIALLVSGGHTQIIDVESYDKQTIIGETIDDAVGEAYDKVARLVGLPYPGGPLLDKLAQTGNPIYPLPEGKVDGYNFSFSGLKTAVSRLVKSFDVKPVVLSKDIVPEFRKVTELKKWLHKNVVALGTVTVKSNGRKVLFSKTGVERSIKRVSNKTRTQAYGVIEELITNCVYGGKKEADNRHSHKVQGQELYYNAIIYDGKLYGIEISVDIPLDSKNANYIYAGHKTKMAPVVTRVSTASGSGSYEADTIHTISITDIIENFNPPQEIKFNIKADICASFQECVSSTLVKKLRRALEASGYKQVVIAGGVAANSEIRRKIFALQDEGYAVFAPPMKYCTDNAAMVGACAYFDTNTFRDLGIEVFSRVTEKSH